MTPKHRKRAIINENPMSMIGRLVSEDKPNQI